jgi:hypothetical protein
MTGCSYIITGKVLPERALIDVSKIVFRTSRATDVSDGQLEVVIIKSQITARFTSAGTMDNVFTLKNLVENAVRSVLDVVGYCNGFGYDVDIVQAVNPETLELQVFGIDVPAVTEFASTARLDFNAVFKLTGDGQAGEFLKASLTDLREATKDPRGTGFHCYRAVESLMKCCSSRQSPPPTNSTAAWELFRATYTIDKDEIMRIKGYADGVRHGDPTTALITDAERAVVLRSAWDIVTRYVRREIEHAA